MRAAIALLAACVATAAVLVPPRRTGQATARAVGSAAVPGGAWLELDCLPPATAFARVGERREFRLPADHGPHFDYRTEWWYFTGNLATRSGAHFGFQLTFFRRGLSPGPPPQGRGLASNQVYFAHLALTDVSAKRHGAVERFSRGAAGLAGASGGPFAVWLEDWRAADCGDGTWRLAGHDAASGLSLDLEVRPLKPLVAHGDRGVSAKSDEPGNASYYFGFTRLSARGTVGLGEREAAVAGEAWFDHEWSTSALGASAVGWDWFSLQLGDGRDLMYFQIRRADGSIEPVSAGTLVAADGRARRIESRDVRLTVERRWTSPLTGVEYPAGWRLEVPAAGLDLRIEPWVADQEMRTSFLYWEGAVRVSGSGAPRLDGQGYVELTGYGRSLQGVF